MSQRQNFIAEIKKELGMRENVWRKVKERDDSFRFLDSVQQGRYDVLVKLKNMVSAMSDAEVNKFVQKSEAVEQPGTIQSLF